MAATGSYPEWSGFCPARLTGTHRDGGQHLQRTFGAEKNMSSKIIDRYKTSPNPSDKPLVQIRAQLIRRII